jgi:molybdate transport system substrate-binding protein
MKAFVALILVIAVCLLAINGFHNNSETKTEAGKGSLMVYCAAGIKKPVAAIAKKYEEELGITVQLQYGGTGTLLSQLVVAKRGDVFIAADDGAVESAREKAAVREAVKLAVQYPVIAVKAGNPKGIKAFDDLLRKDVKVAVSNPEAASIGKRTRKAAGDRWETLKAQVAVMKPTVTELAADLKVGSVDAAVIWNSTVPQFEGLEAVEIPEFNEQKDNVSATILTASTQPQAALKFARYLVAPEKGGAIFTEKGFNVAKGDAWQEKPELILYSGGVNRPAVEKLLQEFAQREGIELTTVFNGCGILCASMQAMTNSANPKFPDAYYACDLCFVPPVAEHFPESVMLTETDIGIAVRKGNPKKIKTLADLAQPGLKVGLCNAEQSTLGFMTQGMLKSSALYDSIRKNVVVEVPTADFLVNQMRAGALEAAIVYEVNYQLQAEHLEFIEIDHPGAKAVQPFSVRGDSPNAQLAGRLLEHLQANRKSFEDTGFKWTGDTGAVKSKDIKVPDWLKPKAKEEK